jgi:hypothetical protein
LLDLKAFVVDLQNKIGKGFIPDGDHKLANACQLVLDSESKMVTARYASNATRMAQWGGLSAYMPRRDAWDSDAHAKRATPLGQIMSDCSGDRVIRRGLVGGDRESALREAHEQAAGYPKTLAELRLMTARVSKLLNQDLSDDQFARINAAICKDASVVIDLEPFSSERKYYRSFFDNDITNQLATGSNHGGWSQFVNEWAKDRH